jgi:hypothetical protein
LLLLLSLVVRVDGKRSWTRKWCKKVGFPSLCIESELCQTWLERHRLSLSLSHRLRLSVSLSLFLFSHERLTAIFPPSHPSVKSDWMERREIFKTYHVAGLVCNLNLVNIVLACAQTSQNWLKPTSPEKWPELQFRMIPGVWIPLPTGPRDSGLDVHPSMHFFSSNDQFTRLCVYVYRWDVYQGNISGFLSSSKQGIHTIMETHGNPIIDWQQNHANKKP